MIGNESVNVVQVCRVLCCCCLTFALPPPLTLLELDPEICARWWLRLIWKAFSSVFTNGGPLSFSELGARSANIAHLLYQIRQQQQAALVGLGGRN